jgi:hypothetical protein
MQRVRKRGRVSLSNHENNGLESIWLMLEQTSGMTRLFYILAQA